MSALWSRCESFCRRYGLRVPILLAPMAGACPPALSIAIAEAGGLGACGALLAIAPAAVSSIMGLYPPAMVDAIHARGMAWFATVTTVEEAKRAEAAGADVIVAQGMEAGGHRGCFDAALAERQQVGLVALLPQVADAVRVPVVATGGIADARGIAAAMMLGASAVQIGTGFLRSPALQAASEAAPAPAPYPVQRGLTAAMRREALRQGSIRTLQAWAGQAAALAQAQPAAQGVQRLWDEARRLLRDAA